MSDYNPVVGGGISSELLARSARRHLSRRYELQATLLGLLGPLAICGWSIAHPFDLRQSYHRLEQCAIWLAAWYVIFAILYVTAAWLADRDSRRGGLPPRDADLRHLPLSSAHFFLTRSFELTAVPLRCAALTLPLWLIVLAYIRLPYGEQWTATEYLWGRDVDVPWLARLAWVTLGLAAATLLPLGAALLVQETVRIMPFRIALLVLPVVLVYAMTRFLPEHLRMPYRTTSPYNLYAFFLLPVAALVLVFAAGLLRPAWRLLAAGTLVLVTAAIVMLPRLDSTRGFAVAVQNAVGLRSYHYSMAWMAGHLSPTRNVRLLLDSLTYGSNVLLELDDLPPEPRYAVNGPNDSYNDADWERYNKAQAAYEERYAALPRMPLWVGAGVFPLLLPLLAFGGLLLGHLRRGIVARDE